MNVTYKHPAELQIGDQVDLQHDFWANLTDDETEAEYLQLIFEQEYAVVEGLEVETPECVRVDFENVAISIGFPASHELKVVEVAND